LAHEKEWKKKKEIPEGGEKTPLCVQKEKHTVAMYLIASSLLKKNLVGNRGMVADERKRAKRNLYMGVAHERV